jgi:hypothetical protein
VKISTDNIYACKYDCAHVELIFKAKGQQKYEIWRTLFIILPNASIAIPEESMATIPTEEERNDLIHQQRPRNTTYKNNE